MSDAPKPDRNLAIDAVKGIGILQVVVHHALGQGSRIYATKGTQEWTIMRTIAWATNFAIPLFLLLSAMLLAGSLVKQPDVGRFVWRRTSRTFWPFLVWTLIYWAIRSRENPGLWTDFERLGFELLRGKASYHLYFMVILLQLSLAVPFVVAIVKRVPMSFITVLAVAFALQYGAFIVQRELIRSQTPATMLYWYVPSLLVGVWIGLNRERWARAWSDWWPVLTVAGIGGGAVYTIMRLDAELGRPWDGLTENATSVFFRVTASLALLGAAAALGRLRIAPLLAALGRYSLPIYLVHPIILRLLGGPRISVAFGTLPLPVLWTIIFVTAVSYAFAWLLSLIRLDLVLFGQSLPRRAKTG